MKAWLLVFAAGLLEVGFAISLKYTKGFTALGPSLLTMTLAGFSLALLSQSLKVLPVGTAYAVWTGLGAVGTALVGMAFFGEPRDAARIGCLLLIVGGVVGLKLVSVPH